MENLSGGPGDAIKKPGGSAEVKPADYKKGWFPGKWEGNEDMDVRDILHGFIARGDKSLNTDAARSGYSYLIGKYGKGTADKIMTHAMIFNNRTDIQGKPFDSKLNTYYAVGSNDPDVDKVIKKMGALGQGPQAGANDSPNVDSMAATGRL